MIAKGSTVVMLREGDFLLCGDTVPIWRKVEEIEEKILESDRYRRIWVEGGRYYDMHPGALAMIGVPS